MEPVAIGIVLLGALLGLIVLGMEIAYAGALIGLLGVWLFSGWEAMGALAGQTAFQQTAKYAMTTVPLFILMGYFAFYGGITGDVFGTARMWVGHIPGGLAIATALACAGFAACSGSSGAATSLMSKVALPELLKAGTAKRLATGVIAASGTLASLIPPSVMIVIYGIITGESIGRLLIAGFIPGIVSVLIYAGMIYIRCKTNPTLSPKTPPVPWKTRLSHTGRGIWGMLALFGLIIGGIYLGIFTPTEAGGVGAFGALVIALCRRGMTWAKLKDSILGTVETTLMVFLLIVGLYLLNYSLAVSGFTSSFTNMMLELGVSRYVVLLGFIFIYFFLGMFIGPIGMVVLTIPIFLPAIVDLGFDRVWFGIIVIKMVEVSGITPPVGMNVFIVTSVAKDITSSEVYKGCLPFLAMDFLTLALFIVFPQIITWLPSMMG